MADYLRLAQYDAVFLGFPIWWYTAPAIVKTFLESYDFSGKKIVLFATSGGSGFGKTRAELEKFVSEEAKMVEGKILNDTYSLAELGSWAQKF